MKKSVRITTVVMTLILVMQTIFLSRMVGAEEKGSPCPLTAITVTQEENKLVIDCDCPQEDTEFAHMRFDFMRDGRRYVVSAEAFERTVTGLRVEYDIRDWQAGSYTLIAVELTDDAGTSTIYGEEELPSSTVSIEWDPSGPAILESGLENLRMVPDKDDERRLTFTWTKAAFTVITLYFYNTQAAKNYVVSVDESWLEDDGYVDYPLIVKPYLTPGTYQLDYIEVTDCRGEEITYPADVYALSILLQHETQQTTSLKLQGELSVSKVNDCCVITFNCADEATACDRIDFEFRGDKGSFTLETDASDWLFTKEGIKVHKRVQSKPSGTYTLTRVALWDKAGNCRLYPSDQDPIPGTEHSFTLDEDDLKVKGLDNLSIEVGDQSANAGEKIIAVECDWTGEPFQELVFYFNHIGGTTHTIELSVTGEHLDGEGHVRCVQWIDPYTVAGSYRLEKIVVKNEHQMLDSYAVDVYDTVIDIVNDNEDLAPPMLDVGSIKLEQQGRLLTIGFDAVEEDSGVAMAMFQFERVGPTRIFTVTRFFDRETGELGSGGSAFSFTENIHAWGVGDYNLKRVVLADHCGNEKTFHIESGTVIQLGVADVKIPGVGEIEVQDLSDREIAVYCDWSSDSPIKTLVLGFRNFQDPDAPMYFVPLDRADVLDGCVEKQVSIPSHMLPGRYVLHRVAVFDTSIERSLIFRPLTDDLIHGLNDVYDASAFACPFFTVAQDVAGGVTAPRLTGIESIAQVDDAIQFVFDTTEDVADLLDVLVHLGGDLYLYGRVDQGLLSLGDNRYQLTWKIPAGMPEGAYRMAGLRLRDAAHREMVYGPDFPLVSSSRFMLSSKRQFVVRFLDWDGSLLKRECVPEGEAATPPQDPTRVGFSFLGWEGDFQHVKQNLEITALYRKDGSGGGVVLPPSSEDDHDPSSVSRLAGDNRYVTAIRVCREHFDASDTVVLASGENFPDALTGSVLAAHYSAPMLLVSDRLDVLEVVTDELKRLSVKEVIILGGEKAVSSYIEEALLKENFMTRRIAGNNRYETAHQIALEVGVEDGHVFVTSSVSFPDALSIGPVAARDGTPVLLSHPSLLIHELEAALFGLGVQDITLIGGPKAISEDVETRLGEDFNVSRVFGEAREDTAVAVASSYFDAVDSLLFASGNNFPDALVCGYAGAVSSSPVLLVREDELRPCVRDFILENAPLKITLVGGRKVISEVVDELLTELLR